MRRMRLDKKKIQHADLRKVTSWVPKSKHANGNTMNLAVRHEYHREDHPTDQCAKRVEKLHSIPSDVRVGHEFHFAIAGDARELVASVHYSQTENDGNKRIF